MTTRAFVFAALALVAAASTAVAKDHSARDAGQRGLAEACCIEGAMLAPVETSPAPDAQALLEVNWIAPHSERRPGLDGADWNCRRPDGSRRCFSSLGNQ
jgi:hypothetical protein